VVRAHNGVITPEDFERYQVRWMEPARGSYRGYELVGSPPPDNGGTHIIEALHMIELLDIERLGPPSESPDTAYQMIRIAHEVMEEGANQTDPASHEVPLDVILSKEYARMRFKLLQMAPVRAHAYTPSPGSTHVTAVDAQGNVATILHSTMASAWSAGLFVEGVSIVSSGGHFLRVMPKPGDRASAYVAPTMVLRSGRPVLASGSPSVSLVANILQNTVNVLDFGMAPEESTHRPRFGRWRAGGFLIEADLYERMGEELEDRGLSLNRVSPWYMYLGSWEGIVIDQASGTYHACGDPRRTGHAEGV
ncbi:MAG: gamma-glutamyltransferase, partial [Acidobacteriota bacterium]